MHVMKAIGCDIVTVRYYARLFRDGGLRKARARAASELIRLRDYLLIAGRAGSYLLVGDDFFTRSATPAMEY